MNRVLAVVILIAGLFACGGSFTSDDANSATNSVNLARQLDVLCAPDAGTCDPAVVRALERPQYCTNAAMLYRHKLPVPDAGISCQASAK